MELFSSNIKKSFYSLKRKHFLYFRKQNPALFSSRPKNKRTQPRENLLYFRKQKPLKTSYISGKRNSKKASYILGDNLQIPKNKQKYLR